MEINLSKCPGCGNDSNLELVDVAGEPYYSCGYCNNKFPKRSVENEYRRLEKTIQSGLGSVVNEALIKEKSEQYFNLRNMLWKKVNANFIDSAAIVDICREIKKISQNDFLAEFFELANSATDDEIAEYIYGIDVVENEIYMEIVLNFIIKSMKQKFITPTAGLLERCGRVFSPAKKQEYLNKFETEARKTQEGIYEIGLKRDVFLAYSSKDMPEVIKILNLIESNGLTCFAAFRNLQHGRDAVANYEKALYEAIDNCSIFVFISSENSRNIACDAFTKEIAYIRNSELKKFPTYRSYEQIPEQHKKLRIEYRIDNKPSYIADKTLKEFFSGLTYAENHEQLLGRLGECIQILSTPVFEDDAKLKEIETSARQKIEEEKRRADALAAEVEALKKNQKQPPQQSNQKPKAELIPKTNIRKEYINGVYTGDGVNGIPHGRGKFLYKHGSVYDGDFQKGLRHGIGTYTSIDGSVYSGEFTSDKATGKARYVLPNGEVYNGDFVDGKYEGEGRFTWTNGAYYEGQFSNNTFHGVGTFCSDEGEKEFRSYANGCIVSSRKLYNDSSKLDTFTKSVRHAFKNLIDGNYQVFLRNEWIKFFICLFVGIFGVHRFIEKKYKSGLLFLFSYGVFFVGWGIDLYKQFMKAFKTLQN